MTKLKHWFIHNYLPAYCRDELLADNARLVSIVNELKQENGCLKAYIDGLERAMRNRRRIVIRNEVTK